MGPVCRASDLGFSGYRFSVSNLEDLWLLHSSPNPPQESDTEVDCWLFCFRAELCCFAILPGLTLIIEDLAWVTTFGTIISCYHPNGLSGFGTFRALDARHLFILSPLNLGREEDHLKIHLGVSLTAESLLAATA